MARNKGTTRVMALGLAFTVVACGGTDTAETVPDSTTTTTPAPQLLQGGVQIRFPNAIAGEDDSCRAREGFDDVRPGVNLVVRDPRGDIVGTTTLGAGKVVRPPEDEVEHWSDAVPWCVFGFSVQVPPNLGFYTVDAGRRGQVTFSQEDLEETGWYAVLSLR